MFWPTLVKLGPPTPEKALSVLSCDPSPKIARENVLNRQQLSRGLFDLSNFVWSLHA